MFRVASIVGFVLCCAAGLACDQSPAAKSRPAKVALAPPVEVTALRVSTVTPTAAGTAEVEAVRSATLRAEAMGRVLSLPYEAGERIKVGAVVARLDVGRASAQLKAAQTSVRQAEAQLARSRRERELAQRLAKQGTMAQQSVDGALDGERIAEAALQSALAQTGVSRRGLKEAVVAAPFNGTIADRLVEVGEYVSPGTAVATLVDAEQLKASVLLDPRRALDVTVGAKVTCQVFARAGESFEGQVTRVSQVIDSRSRKLPVELSIADPQDRLRPGLVARFEVEVGEPRQALMVDEGAVFERFGQSYVYLLDGQLARRQAVRLGEARREQIEILEGLGAGQLVITRGIDRVVDGHPVRVVQAPVAEAR